LEWAESYVFSLPVRRALNGLVGDDGAGGHILPSCCVVDLSNQG
jgi:hypothetical protein